MTQIDTLKISAEDWGKLQKLTETAFLASDMLNNWEIYRHQPLLLVDVPTELYTAAQKVAVILRQAEVDGVLTPKQLLWRLEQVHRNQCLESAKVVPDSLSVSVEMSCLVNLGRCNGFGSEHAACWLCKACQRHSHHILSGGDLKAVPCPNSGQ